MTGAIILNMPTAVAFITMAVLLCVIFASVGFSLGVHVCTKAQAEWVNRHFPEDNGDTE